ncbi:hypothetical protein LWI28_029058 [Acer negundo]|uniref:Uncharacterized protein n=1 Tax=Acer negundo TaxID=4023 RepID=A0AAD5J928_ACENE|nr:hypothetical protein LWI28_029058 [Acer negundo]
MGCYRVQFFRSSCLDRVQHSGLKIVLRRPVRGNPIAWWVWSMGFDIHRIVCQRTVCDSSLQFSKFGGDSEDEQQVFGEMSGTDLKSSWKLGIL